MAVSTYFCDTPCPSAITGDAATLMALTALESWVVDTNEVVRQRVLRLIDLGVSQKTLAKEMGVTETWFSRWVNLKTDPPLVIDVAAMDGFQRFVDRLRAAIEETQGAAVAAAPGPPFRDRDSSHDVGKRRRR